MNKENKFYIILGGPTAIGKTKIAIKMAKEFDGEIVNADSRQIYKDFDIGTGKPSEEEFKEVKHHLFGFLDGNQRFSAYDYMKLASDVILDLIEKKKVPIVVGGTGLYIHSLLYGLFPDGERDETLREKIKIEGEKKGWDFLYEKLEKIDFEYAKKININDKIRIIRALEVYYKTGKSLTENFKATESPLKELYPIKIFVNEKRKILYEKINKRVLQMFKEGLIEEVKKLVALGYNEQCPAFQSIGYRYVILYLRGEIDREKAIELMQRDTRHYAKRQIVWFKKEKGFQHFNPDDSGKISEYIKREIRWKKLSL